MDSVFISILNMSLTASFVILFIIIARLALKKAPKVFSYALWFVAFYRLISPFSFESVLSLIPINKSTVPQVIVTDTTTPVINSGINVVNNNVNQAIGTAVTPEVVNPLKDWITIGNIIWWVGIVVIIAYSVFATIRLYKSLRNSRHITEDIYENDAIETAFVFGLIKPRIYLPIGISDKEYMHIVEHEKTHIRRLDHIVKPIMFFISCMHWFNPLVWLAFFLMSEDMELSCDESVIRQMGSGIKKDYTSSLLALSTGKRIVGGCPLAFGENDTKGRILNVLNYKKPKFWVILISCLVVIVLCIGLVSNPITKYSTIEDFANIFINDDAEGLANSKPRFKIEKTEITRLEKIGEFEDIYKYPVELWALEYTITPDQYIYSYIPPGRNFKGVSFTEDTGSGKPILVVARNGRKLEYLGCAWTIFNNFDSKAGQEIALRKYLEEYELVEKGSYSSEHILIKYRISTGETCQMLLSRPNKNTQNSIWVVERWKDSQGNVYHTMPSTDMSIDEYYAKLQADSEREDMKYLLDSTSVALKFIKDHFDMDYTVDDIEIKNNATMKDFEDDPISKYLGYIMKVDIENKSFHLDFIEWIDHDQVDRIKDVEEELNIDNLDMPNGYYIYNPNSYPQHFMSNGDTKFIVLDWGGTMEHKEITMEEFKSYLETYNGFSPPFIVTTKSGYVLEIMEQYVP